MTRIFPILHAIRYLLKTLTDPDLKFSFATSLFVTSFISQCFLMFSNVFPSTELFMSLKKSFSKLFFTPVRRWVLNSKYDANHVPWLNSIAQQTLSKTNPCLSTWSKAVTWVTYLFLSYKFGTNFWTPLVFIILHMNGIS